MWNTLRNKGYIYEGQHTGYYSVNDETFYMEKDLVKCEKSGSLKTELGEIVEEISETNYKFKFTKEVMDEVNRWVHNSAVEP